MKFHIEVINQYQSDFEKMKFALIKSQETLMGYLNGVVVERNEDPSKNYQLNIDDYTLEPAENISSNNGSGSVESINPEIPSKTKPSISVE